jgi:hypothetical protein
MNKELRQLPDTIYLIYDGERVVWCDEPDPCTGMDPNDAVKYVRCIEENKKLCCHCGNVALYYGLDDEKYCPDCVNNMIRSGDSITDFEPIKIL